MKYYTNLFMLINEMPSLEAKLDALTHIGISIDDDELFQACEEVRNQIVPDNQDVYIEKTMI